MMRSEPLFELTADLYTVFDEDNKTGFAKRILRGAGEDGQ